MPPARDSSEPGKAALRLEFGSRVRKARTERQLTQETLAERCDVHWTYIGQIERGVKNLTLANVVRIAQGLDLDPGVLVTGLHLPD